MGEAAHNLVMSPVAMKSGDLIHLCSCGTPHLHVLAGGTRIDPTHTSSLRRQFVADMTRRFSELRRAIVQAILKDDVLGIGDKATLPLGQSATIPLIINVSPGRATFAFDKNPVKVQKFMGWLKREQDVTIFKTKGMVGGVMPGQPWTNVYVDTGYRKGVRRAMLEMKKKGMLKGTAMADIVEGKLGKGPLEANFMGPVHAERAAMIYQRTFDDLKGITATMDTKISGILAEGLLSGKGPLEMAKGLLQQVGLSKNRANTLARTEVIRAHHLGLIETYRQAGVVGVTVLAEWLATDDDRVCPECWSMQGEVFSLDDIEGMIPAHPNCRCCAIPVVPEAGIGTEKSGKKASYEKQQDRAAAKREALFGA